MDQCYTVLLESLSHPQSKKIDLTIIQSLLERVQISKICWKTEESAGHGVSFLKQETHEQSSQGRKTPIDHQILQGVCKLSSTTVYWPFALILLPRFQL